MPPTSPFRRKQSGHCWGYLVFALLIAAAALPPAASAADRLERVTFTDDRQQERTVEGRIRTEAQDGGILLQGRDGRLWTVTPEQLQSRTATEDEFKPLSADALAKQLQDELGPGALVITTPHYVVVAKTSRVYAEWCAGLFERLYTAFRSHWTSRGLKLIDPDFPLPAIILADETQFAKFATLDAGPAAASAKGYYAIGSNRMVLYDLTAGNRNGPRSAADIENQLAAASFNVATVIHEATHQIAFNSGLHTRYADNPLWLTEGMAMYFETPDLRSKTGWKTAGALNRMRLRQFQDYATRRRPLDSLETLIRADGRLTVAETAGDAYAEAWALTFFLNKTRAKAYAAYLERIAAKPCLIWDTPDERAAEFRAVFGEDLDALDLEFVRHMKRLRAQ